MLPDSFTLSVNEDADDGTTPAVDVEFTRFLEAENRSEYIATSEHNASTRSKMGFYRTFPKSTGNFRGTYKSAVKLTKDIVVPGVDNTTEIIVPTIVEIKFSLPVGISEESELALRQRMLAMVNSKSIMDKLLVNQLV